MEKSSSGNFSTTCLSPESSAHSKIHQSVEDLPDSCTEFGQLGEEEANFSCSTLVNRYNDWVLKN